MRLHSIVMGIVVGMVLLVGVSMVRYPVGEPVPAAVYTGPFDAADGIYRFMQTNFGDPNTPRYQAAPDDWIKNFGNNERTLLFHTISELRVIVAQQEKRIKNLELRLVRQGGIENYPPQAGGIENKDPNEVK